MAGLAEAVNGAVGQPASVRIGRVASVNPTVITAQGVPFRNVGLLKGYTPQVGEAVVLLGQSSASGSDPASWLALGSPRTTMQATQAGTFSLSFGPATSFTVTLGFPQAFAAPPNVHVNINSGSGTIAGWNARAINITATTFDIFVFGASATWVAIPVQWTAIPRTA